MARIMRLSVLLPVLSAVQALDLCAVPWELRIQGKYNFGSLEVCYYHQNSGLSKWWPVCGYHISYPIDNNYDHWDGSGEYFWNKMDATVACRQLNFTDPSHQDHEAYMTAHSESNSKCLELDCPNENLNQISSCNFYRIWSAFYLQAAVICDSSPLQTDKCDLTTSPADEKDPQTKDLSREISIQTEVLSTTTTFIANEKEPSTTDQNMIKSRQMKDLTSTENEIKCAANNSSLMEGVNHHCLIIGASVGALIGLFTITLLCILPGWVWLHCKRNKNFKNSSKLHFQSIDDHFYDEGNAASHTLVSIRNGKSGQINGHFKKGLDTYDASYSNETSLNEGFATNYEIPLESQTLPGQNQHTDDIYAVPDREEEFRKENVNRGTVLSYDLPGELCCIKSMVPRDDDQVVSNGNASPGYHTFEVREINENKNIEPTAYEVLETKK